jgi:hypothetical protein
MKAILVLTSTNPFYEEELKSLCEACHIEVVDVVIQKLEKINPATYIGKGKIEEIKLKLQDEMVIFDDELTPLQVKNLTDLLETEVTDRTDLILRIFVSFLQDVFPQFSFDYLKGILEFSSGSLKIIHQSKKMLPFVCFFLSFSGFSVMMQADNLLEAIPYSFKKYFLSRLYHGILSFILCLLFLQFGLI